jgi:hypothetical protein
VSTFLNVDTIIPSITAQRQTGFKDRLRTVRTKVAEQEKRIVLPCRAEPDRPMEMDAGTFDGGTALDEMLATNGPIVVRLFDVFGAEFGIEPREDFRKRLAVPAHKRIR